LDHDPRSGPEIKDGRSREEKAKYFEVIPLFSAGLYKDVIEHDQSQKYDAQ